MSTNIHIHFICTGNTYRSRMAETYLRSLKLQDVTVSSSGIKAHENNNGPITWYASRIFAKYRIVSHMAPTWTKTTKKHIETADIVIFMHPDHLEYCKVEFGLSGVTYEVWNIPDIDDVHPDYDLGKGKDLAYIQTSEDTFDLIKKKVHELADKKLKKKYTTKPK